MSISSSKIRNFIQAGLAKTYGKQAGQGIKFEVLPAQVQRIEKKQREQYEFLNLITNTLTDENTAEIISLEDGQSVGARNVTGRTPAQMDGFVGRSWAVKDVEADIMWLWKTMTRWGGKSSQVQRAYSARVIRARALSELRKMFYGQSYNPVISSDIANNPMLEDVQKGLFQYLIDNDITKVFGITSDALDPKGYIINPINVGEGGDFASMVHLVDFLKNEKISRLHRGSSNIRAVMGDSLATYDVSNLIKTSGNTPSERQASEALMQLNTVAKIPTITPDQFPSHGLFLTDPKNFERVVQQQSVHRQVADDQDLKAMVDHLWMEIDYVIKELDAIAAVHPDAIRLKDSAGNWVAAADTWAINPVV